MTELVYERGTRSAEEVQQEIDKFWAELDKSDELHKQLTDSGIDLAAVPDPLRPGAIRVDTRGAGLDPVSVSLVIAFAPAANAVLTSLWHQVLLPRIRSRYG